MHKRHNTEADVAGFRYIRGRGIVPNALAEPLKQSEPGSLRVNIVFTDVPTTQVALKRALELAVDLASEIRVIVPHVVPYPLALECPVVPLEFTCNQIRTLAASVGADPCINVCLCRDVVDLLLKVLPAGSIVVLGTGKRWLLPTKTERVARRLRKKGYAVVLV